MQIDVPFSVEYQTEAAVPIDDVIDSLLSIRAVLRDSAELLPSVIPGLEFQGIEIHVSRISQQSPLRELFVATLIVAFQDDLEREVPPLVEQLIHHQIPDGFRTIVTVVAMMLVFYGINFVLDAVTGKAKDGPSKRRLSALVAETAKATGRSEDDVLRTIKQKYDKQGKLHKLARDAIRFFKPSKTQNNAPILVGDRHIERELVVEAPQNFLFEDALKSEVYEEVKGAELDLRAQDRDRDSQGWKAIIKGVTPSRVNMKLVDDVTPDQLWQRDSIRGDVVIVYRRSAGTLVPREIHLTRITG
jgi:hypothetical protein